jgi:hypothetical protein
MALIDAMKLFEVVPTVFAGAGRAIVLAFMGLAGFVCAQAVTVIKIQKSDPDAAQVAVHTLSVMDETFSLVQVLATSFGVLTVEPVSKLSAGAVVGLSGAMKQITTTALKWADDD